MKLLQFTVFLSLEALEFSKRFAVQAEELYRSRS